MRTEQNLALNWGALRHCHYSGTLSSPIARSGPRSYRRWTGPWVGSRVPRAHCSASPLASPQLPFFTTPHHNSTTACPFASAQPPPVSPTHEHQLYIATLDTTILPTALISIRLSVRLSVRLFIRLSPICLQAPISSWPLGGPLPSNRRPPRIASSSHGKRCEPLLQLIRNCWPRMELAKTPLNEIVSASMLGASA